MESHLIHRLLHLELDSNTGSIRSLLKTTFTKKYEKCAGSCILLEPEFYIYFMSEWFNFRGLSSHSFF